MNTEIDVTLRTAKRLQPTELPSSVSECYLILCELRRDRLFIRCSAGCSLLLPHTALRRPTRENSSLRPELLADTNAIVPGKPFTVGLLLRMAPGWHTYWKFSGDAGLPTEMKWKLPPGWKVGDIQWPIPLKTIDPGDIETYGYENEVLLMQEITPPAKHRRFLSEAFR